MRPIAARDFHRKMLAMRERAGYTRGMTNSLVLAFAVVAVAQPPSANIAATVNGETISLTDVDEVLKRTLPLTPLTVAQQRQMRLEVLADMVDDLLLRQFLRKNGPKLDATEIDAQFQAFGEKLKKDGKTLADFYKETGQTESQVREAWTTEMQLTGYVKSNTTEEQLKAYYHANKDHFDRVQVQARHIVIRVGKNATPVERAAAKEKLEKLRTEILAGKLDFAAAAKTHSHCPSGRNGGDIGLIARKDGLMEEVFCKAAFALKPNKLSNVVVTNFGVHIIHVIDRTPGSPSTYEQVATDVLDTYTDEYRNELIAKLRKQGRIEVTVP